MASKRRRFEKRQAREELRPAEADFGAMLVAVRNFPATTMILAPYLLLILPGALINKNPETPFIITVLSMALAATLIIETILLLMRSHSHRGNQRMELVSNASPKEYSLAPRYVAFGPVSILIGIVASNGSALLGAGTIEQQVGDGGGGGPLAGLLTPFQGYVLIGVALLAWGYRLGGCTGRFLASWLCIALIARVIYVLQLGITIQLLRFLITAAVLLIFLGIIRPRVAIYFAATTAILWPILFEFRNQLRESRGVWVDPYTGAFDRLRYDVQISAAANIPPGQDIGQIQGLEVIRFGLIPGFLDPDRGSVDTGGLINSALLGGTVDSSFTFLPITTAYILEGPIGMVLLYSVFTVLTAIVLKASPGLNAWRLVLFAFIISGPLGWFSVHPNSSIGFLQDIVAATPLILLIYATKAKSSNQEARNAPTFAPKLYTGGSRLKV